MVRLGDNLRRHLRLANHLLLLRRKLGSLQNALDHCALRRNRLLLRRRDIRGCGRRDARMERAHRCGRLARCGLRLHNLLAHMRRERKRSGLGRRGGGLLLLLHLHWLRLCRRHIVRLLVRLGLRRGKRGDGAACQHGRGGRDGGCNRCNRCSGRSDGRNGRSAKRKIAQALRCLESAADLVDLGLVGENGGARGDERSGLASTSSGSGGRRRRRRKCLEGGKGGGGGRRLPCAWRGLARGLSCELLELGLDVCNDGMGAVVARDQAHVVAEGKLAHGDEGLQDALDRGEDRGAAEAVSRVLAEEEINVEQHVIDVEQMHMVVERGAQLVAEHLQNHRHERGLRRDLCLAHDGELLAEIRQGCREEHGLVSAVQHCVEGVLERLLDGLWRLEVVPLRTHESREHKALNDNETGLRDTAAGLEEDAAQGIEGKDEQILALLREAVRAKLRELGCELVGLALNRGAHALNVRDDIAHLGRVDSRIRKCGADRHLPREGRRDRRDCAHRICGRRCGQWHGRCSGNAAAALVLHRRNARQSARLRGRSRLGENRRLGRRDSGSRHSRNGSRGDRDRSLDRSRKDRCDRRERAHGRHGNGSGGKDRSGKLGGEHGLGHERHDGLLALGLENVHLEAKLILDVVETDHHGFADRNGGDGGNWSSSNWGSNGGDLSGLAQLEGALRDRGDGRRSGCLRGRSSSGCGSSDGRR
eukprot:comp22346_c0_seq1/m.53836 comp22346_c0_seq1/g.53836  ORF comp22346_c0_seq1/g.53836 comp22346_c0_seq1/m.53836 type:complete len:705 (-) comp22346_c0_seq1:801-2915(-)